MPEKICVTITHKLIQQSLFWPLNYHVHFSLLPMAKDMVITVAGLSAMWDTDLTRLQTTCHWGQSAEVRAKKHTLMSSRTLGSLHLAQCLAFSRNENELFVFLFFIFIFENELFVKQM